MHIRIVNMIYVMNLTAVKLRFLVPFNDNSITLKAQVSFFSVVTSNGANSIVVGSKLWCDRKCLLIPVQIVE